MVSSPETASTSPISLPPPATGCPQSRMVRRGSRIESVSAWSRARTEFRRGADSYWRPARPFRRRLAAFLHAIAKSDHTPTTMTKRPISELLTSRKTACLCHGRYWARTSDLQLVERDSASRGVPLTPSFLDGLRPRPRLRRRARYSRRFGPLSDGLGTGTALVPIHAGELPASSSIASASNGLAVLVHSTRSVRFGFGFSRIVSLHSPPPSSSIARGGLGC